MYNLSIEKFYYEVLKEISLCTLRDSLEILRINDPDKDLSFKKFKSGLKAKMEALGLSHIKIESCEGLNSEFK